MSKKCISIMVLCAFIHSLVAGCMKTTTVYQPEINAESTECCVYEVILTNEEIYKFEKPGGHFNIVPHLIIGTLNDGRKFFRVLTDKSLKAVRISTGQTISRVDLARYSDQTISEIMVDKYIYTFNQNGGRLKADVNTIHGTIKSGDEINVPVEYILFANIKSADTSGTVKSVKLVKGLFLLVMLHVAYLLAFEASN